MPAESSTCAFEASSVGTAGLFWTLPRNDAVSAEMSTAPPSAVPIDEAAKRVKQAIAEKGIQFFNEIDQSKLAANAGIKLRPSVLLVFGNPPLGTQFITANPNAGLDWPVRMLLTEDENGQVWAVYTDFG